MPSARRSASTSSTSRWKEYSDGRAACSERPRPNPS